jgi:DNA-directed RNA polymerase subunit H (RpoH/RPB5)
MAGAKRPKNVDLYVGDEKVYKTEQELAEKENEAVRMYEKKLGRVVKVLRKNKNLSVEEKKKALKKLHLQKSKQLKESIEQKRNVNDEGIRQNLKIRRMKEKGRI